MPTFPYRVEEPTRSQLSADTTLLLECWVNYGLGETAEFDLEEFWFELFCGRAHRAARLASKSLLTEMGWLLAEMAENWPSNAFGSEEDVRAWRGLVETDPTLLEET